MLFCPKQPKYHYHFISKSVFSLNALVDWGLAKWWRGGKGGSSKCWRLLTKGGGGVRQLLTIVDEGGREGMKTSKIGWHNMWTASIKCHRRKMCRRDFVQIKLIQNTAVLFCKVFFSYSLWGHVLNSPPPPKKYHLPSYSVNCISHIL